MAQLSRETITFVLWPGRIAVPNLSDGFSEATLTIPVEVVPLSLRAENTSVWLTIPNGCLAENTDQIQVSPRED